MARLLPAMTFTYALPPPIYDDTVKLMYTFPSLTYKSAQAEIVRRRRAHNASSSFIHRLPSELFMIIFAEVVARTGWPAGIFEQKESHLIKLWRLAQVSTVWRDIVKLSPELWYVVDVRDPLQGWRASLKRSKATPIEVTLMPSTALSLRKANQEFWDDVSRHIPRWRTAVLNLMAESDASPLTEWSAHRLRQADITFVGDDYFVLDLFHGVAPRLEDLRLNNMSLLDWNTPFICSTRLKVLTLKDITYSGPTVRQVAMILRSCGALERLKLWMVTYTASFVVSNHHGSPGDLSPEDDENNNSTTRIISLPRLQELRIYPVTTDLATQILGVLDAPNCIVVQIGTMAEGEDAKIVNRQCVWVVSPILDSALTSASRIQLTLDNSGCSIVVSVDHPFKHLSLKVVAPNTELSIEWALNAYKHVLATLPTTVFLGVLPPNSLQYFITVLRRLPSIKNLRLRGSHVCTVLEALAAKPAPHHAWLCPKLEGLYIEDGCVYRRPIDIYTLVDVRTRASETAAWLEIAGLRTHVPVRLLKLQISKASKMDGKTFRKIQSVLGRVVAEWHGAVGAQESEEMDVEPANTDYLPGGALYPVEDDGYSSLGLCALIGVRI
ncbi:hypothetical protein FRB96_002949 [Tulasnella sp. 330]|nr:hypothetical protein FRB96_002949 [Tulasnella sp. 330]KAG8874698.1 hypothetical protein FRB97_005731 [Tulasnella sp. 331]KAG8879574.1 hypothetical protein FRB98_005654 [Tulasnella sp. 332]